MTTLDAVRRAIESSKSVNYFAAPVIGGQVMTGEKCRAVQDQFGLHRWSSGKIDHGRSGHVIVEPVPVSGDVLPLRGTCDEQPQADAQHVLCSLVPHGSVGLCGYTDIHR